MRVISLALGALAGAMAAGDATASTSAVTAEFMGASGGMKLLKTGETGFLMVSQSKLEEVDEEGKKCAQCTSINVAGQNSWTPLEETKVNNVTTIYSTTFNVVDSGVAFSLTAHLAQTTSTVDEEVPCSGCSTGAGSCKATNGTCEASTDSTCSVNTTMCTETVEVTADQLKFSFVVSGFTFRDATNKLSYAIELKDKNGNTGGAVADGKVDLGDGYMELPTIGMIKGGDADKEVTASITTSVQGAKTIIQFEFSSWPDGESLYYDPTLVLATPEPSDGFSVGSKLMANAVTGGLFLLTALHNLVL